MLAWIIFTIALGISSLRARPAGERIRLDKEGICYTCGYDLSGTPRPLPCPECGQTEREHYRIRASNQYIFLPDRLLWAAWFLPPLLVYTGFYSLLAEWLAVMSYRVAGYPLHTARFAAHARELADGSAAVLWPMDMAIGLVPLLAMVPRRQWRLAGAATLWASGALALLSLWVLRYL